jgi:hypothetical protein
MIERSFYNVISYYQFKFILIKIIVHNDLKLKYDFKKIAQFNCLNALFKLMLYFFIIDLINGLVKNCLTKKKNVKNTDYPAVTYIFCNIQLSQKYFS